MIRSFSFEIAIISVGNLTLGGTGKTPIIEYLIRLLKENYRIAVLSRGYKRKTRGFRITDKEDTALTVGDEPFQYYRKHKHEIVVAVGEDRILAIPGILYEHPERQCILLDDAFQQRQIKPDIQILLCDFNRPFFNDHVIPAGYLRESRRNANRADLVIVTKCPENLSEKNRSVLIKKMLPYLKKDIPVFFSFIRYEKPQPAWEKGIQPAKKVILVTGIARTGPLVQYISAKYELVKHFEFQDHHFFKIRELEKIIRFYEEGSKNTEISIIFTEKDIARLSNTPLEDYLRPYPVFFQPITYNFAGNGQDFDRLIIDKIERSVKVD